MMWTNHFAACEYADRKVFVRGLESFNPKQNDILYSQWLYYYDQYFIKLRSK